MALGVGDVDDVAKTVRDPKRESGRIMKLVVIDPLTIESENIS